MRRLWDSRLREGAAGTGHHGGRSPPVPEAGLFRLELQGLQEDRQGILEIAVFIQALALGTEGQSIGLATPGPTLGQRGETQETGTELIKSG